MVQEPVVSSRALKAVEDALRAVKPKERAERLDFRDILAAEVEETSEERDDEDEDEDEEKRKLFESSSALRSSYRSLGDETPSFVAHTVRGWVGAGMAVSTSGLGAFKKWTSASVNVEIDVDSATRRPPVDGRGNWAYLAISDEATCAIYGLPEAQGDTASMVLTEVHVGSTKCLPCAAFRRGPADPAAATASASPAVSGSSTPAPISGGGGSQVSATNSPLPATPPDDSWKDATVPPKAATGGDEGAKEGGGGGGGGDGSSSLWPWSTSDIGAGSQVGLIFLGAIIGVTLTVFVARKLGVLPARRGPLVVVRRANDMQELEEEDEDDEVVVEDEQAQEDEEQGGEVELDESAVSAGKTQIREASKAVVPPAPLIDQQQKQQQKQPRIQQRQQEKQQQERDSIEDGWSSDE
jgi:hypothetical protein